MKSEKLSVVGQMFAQALQHHQAGRLSEADTLYHKILALDPRHADSLHLLGVVANQHENYDGAVALFGKAIAINNKNALYHSNLGNAFKAQELLDKAVACYRRALALNPDFAEAHTNLGNVLKIQGRLADAVTHHSQALALNPNFAEAHNNLGNALYALGRRDEAALHYSRAIEIRPAYAEAHFNLGNLHKSEDRMDDAKACFARAVAIHPGFAEAHNNLGSVLRIEERLDDAAAHYRQALASKPDFIDARYNLANILKQQGKLDEAITHYERLLELHPQDAEAQVALGNAMLAGGRRDDAFRLFYRAHALRPLAKRAGALPTPEFSVLLLNAPGDSNTPSDYLVGQANYDSYFLMLLPDAVYDAAALRRGCDVVVNLLSDADMGRQSLPQAGELIDRLDLPTINHPSKILTTSREAMAARLAGIPGLHVPKIRRITGTDLAADPTAGLTRFSFPLLVRLCGTHGGDDFEKLADRDAVVDFICRKPEADYYVIAYAPYESADGYFRKYRLIFTNRQIFPYHLAIADQWKAHHFRTDMANQDWMREEEAAFLENPQAVFGPAQWQALREVQTAVGLDYFGIDCAIDHRGDVLVFEVNATMLVHDETSTFRYKKPYIARIKQAFDAMLARAAQRY